MATVVLDRGHHGKLRDERGARHGDLVEEVLVREYLRHAEDLLRELGHRPVIQSSHPERAYQERWRRADAYKPDVYVQAHINAGGGDYGLVGYDHRSRWGRSIAQHVAQQLGRHTGLQRVIAQPCQSDDWTKRMYGVISGIYASRTAAGIVYEPGFIDRPAHADLWTPDGLELVGRALANGIDDYIRSRRRAAA